MGGGPLDLLLNLLYTTRSSSGTYLFFSLAFAYLVLQWPKYVVGATGVEETSFLFLERSDRRRFLLSSLIFLHFLTNFWWDLFYIRPCMAHRVLWRRWSPWQRWTFLTLCSASLLFLWVGLNLWNRWHIIRETFSFIGPIYIFPFPFLHVF